MVVKATTKNGSALHGADGPQVARHGGLVRVAAVLGGHSPLLLNAMSEAQLLAIRDKIKQPKSAARPSVRDEAASKVYLLPDGRPHFPVKNLMSCLIAAGVFIRLDAKRQVSTAKATLLPGMLSIEDHELVIFRPGTDEAAAWEVDIQQGKNPNGGEAVCIVRPRFDEWELRPTLEIDQSEMPLGMAYELVTKAGKKIGLGDGRPQRKLTFGTFVIRHWQALEAARDNAA